MKKTIMVHIDGIPTHSIEELGAYTVLQVAQTPQLDDLVRDGELGRLGVPTESRLFTGELAFLSLLGYDPQKCFAGPGAFEGKNLEVLLDRNDLAYLCDFVTLRAEDGWGDGKKLGSSLVMDNVTGGGLETEEARELIDAINEQLVSENIQFYMGEHARHLMVWVGGNAKVGCRNPQEALGQSIDGYLAAGAESQVLRELMEAARAILRHHPVNQERVSAGIKPANCLWLWGQSKPVELTSLKERWSIQGTAVSQSGPYRGVAMASGLEVVKVEDHGESQPDLIGGMASITTKILEKQDLACLHVPFSSGLLDQGLVIPASRAVQRLEQIDEYLVGPLRQSCGETGEVRLFVVATPCANISNEEGHPPARYVLYEGSKTGGEPSTLSFHDQEISAQPLQNAANFFERLFGKK